MLKMAKACRYQGVSLLTAISPVFIKDLTAKQFDCANTAHAGLQAPMMTPRIEYRPSI